MSTDSPETTPNPDRQYVYTGEVRLDDDTMVMLDLEERGWADKEMLARTVRFSLVPKPGHPDYPVVSVRIPKNAKPVFKTRVYTSEGTVYGSPMYFSFRVYAVGYKLGRSHHLIWVIPGGKGIELCPDDPELADVLNVALIDHFSKIAQEDRAAEAALNEEQHGDLAS